MRVEIANLHRRYKVNERSAERIIRGTLRRLKKPLPEAIEIAFVGDRAMRRFNKIYKKHDRFTDVLSFRLEGREFGIRDFLGQIIISLDRALANCASFGKSPAEEAVLYVTHGILHLFGYDDLNPAGRARMRTAEKKILEHLCTKEDLSKVLTRR